MNLVNQFVNTYQLVAKKKGRISNKTANMKWEEPRIIDEEIKASSTSRLITMLLSKIASPH